MCVCMRQAGVVPKGVKDKWARVAQVLQAADPAARTAYTDTLLLVSEVFNFSSSASSHSRSLTKAPKVMFDKGTASFFSQSIESEV